MHIEFRLYFKECPLTRLSLLSQKRTPIYKNVITFVTKYSDLPNWQLGGRLIRTSALSCAEQCSAITDMTVQQRHATRSVTLCANKDEPLVGVARKLVKEGDAPSLPSQIPSHPSQGLFRELSEFDEF